MKFKLNVNSVAAAVLLIIPAISAVGCGDGSDSVVIKPGEPYQPTAEEQATIDFVEKEMAGRSGQQR
ncbi:hypothetical protein [Rubripirellula reticaptiva]|nr:hypothetical protein [Rubripirellula reticaptiva]